MSEKDKDIVKSSSGKSDKPGFMQRVKKFFKEYRGELKKISWPTMAEVVKNTMITLAAVLMIGIVIWIADFLFTSLRDAAISIDKAPVSASDVISDSAVTPEQVLDEVSSAADVVTSIADEVAEG
ncbi:MAG: preprotein translocase subunit SecE [Ruminococcaceae bacterium]|nr:preprotein translocase subunit SecE [Oscillospiraceae bacterium]